MKLRFAFDIRKPKAATHKTKNRSTASKTITFPSATWERVYGRGPNHNPYGFTVWLAGGGTRGGQAIGATDDLGICAVDRKIHVHDLHATMLHALGFNHEKLTYHFEGRARRLTDVFGHVVEEVLA